MSFTIRSSFAIRLSFIYGIVHNPRRFFLIRPKLGSTRKTAVSIRYRKNRRTRGPAYATDSIEGQVVRRGVAGPVKGKTMYVRARKRYVHWLFANDSIAFVCIFLYFFTSARFLRATGEGEKTTAVRGARCFRFLPTPPPPPPPNDYDHDARAVGARVYSASRSRARPRDIG